MINLTSRICASQDGITEIELNDKVFLNDIYAFYVKEVLFMKEEQKKEKKSKMKTGLTQATVYGAVIEELEQIIEEIRIDDEVFTNRPITFANDKLALTLITGIPFCKEASYCSEVGGSVELLDFLYNDPLFNVNGDTHFASLNELINYKNWDAEFKDFSSMSLDNLVFKKVLKKIYNIVIPRMIKFSIDKKVGYDDVYLEFECHFLPSDIEG